MHILVSGALIDLGDLVSELKSLTGALFAMLRFEIFQVEPAYIYIPLYTKA
jgi:hypothetical protein